MPRLSATESPRAFTDEHEHRFDTEGLTDVVPERDACLGCDDQRGDAVAVVEFSDQRVDHARGVVGQGTGREPVGEDKADVRLRLWQTRQVGGAATQIGPAQVLAARGCPAANPQRVVDADLVQPLDQLVDVEWVVDGVARRGVCGLELQDMPGRQRVSGTTESDACLRGGPQRRPNVVVRRHIWGVHQPAASARSGDVARSTGRIRPFASAMPRLANQASNSGAGRSPNTFRTYKAS